jgi:hypothetical protein
MNEMTNETTIENGKTALRVDFEAARTALMNLLQKLAEHEGWRETARAVAETIQDLDVARYVFIHGDDPL